MNCSHDSQTRPDHADPRFDRVRRSALFRVPGAFEQWQQADLVFVGAGALGWRCAVEAVRAGAGMVRVVDHDVFSDANAGTQLGQPGVAKAISVARQCDAIRPGHAEPLVSDVRSIGVGVLDRADLIVDCSDDASLGRYLAIVSNGVSTPVIRAAVDGTGLFDIGRVVAWHGGEGYACAMCSMDLAQLRRLTPRVPCPGSVPAGPPPTLTDGATAMTIAGLALRQAMRIVTGNSRGALGRELIVDFERNRILDNAVEPSRACLSGHQRWLLETITLAAEPTLGGVLDVVSDHLGAEDVTVTPFNHPVWLAACSSCEDAPRVVVTPWRSSKCHECGCSIPMYMYGVCLEDLDRPCLATHDLASTPVSACAIPPGAMFDVVAGREARRFIIDWT